MRRRREPTRRMKNNDPDTPPETAVQRILLTLESGLDEEALMAAIELARVMRAHLTQQFIKNVQLLQIAALPFAREIRLTTATLYPLNRRELLGQLEAQALRSRQRLAHLARQYRLEWNHLESDEVLAGGAHDALLLVYGRRGEQLSLGRRQGQGPILTLFDGSKASRLGLKAALSLSRRGDDILILLLADEQHPLGALQAAVREFMARERLTLPALPFITGRVEQLQELARTYHARLLILGASSTQLSAQALQGLLEARPCPLVIIPPDAAGPACA